LWPPRIAQGMDELLDRWREFAQRFENHEIYPRRRLDDPRIGTEPDNLNVPPVGIADLPGNRVINLGTVADGHDRLRFRERREVLLKDSCCAPATLPLWERRDLPPRMHAPALS
jgi:hypothetical protein